MQPSIVSSSSELLERLQSELDEAPHTHVLTLSTPYRDVALPHEVLPNLFQVKVVSEVSVSVYVSVCVCCVSVYMCMYVCVCLCVCIHVGDTNCSREPLIT